MSSMAYFIMLVILGICGAIPEQENPLKCHKNWKLLPDPSECGKSIVNERIVGGSTTKLGQYPWIANLVRRYRRHIEFLCGGSLINDNHVLTAAHCIIPGVNFIRLGEHDLNTIVDCEESFCAPPAMEYRILNTIRHPAYRPKTMKHDIALVKLRDHVTFHKFLQPICLPQSSMLSSYHLNGTVIVAGWGSTDPNPENGIYPSKLQHVSLPVVSLKLCRDIFSMPLDENHYCVGEKDRDSCVGDSGGPMMKSLKYGHSKKYTLFGVVSYGSSICGEHPAVYTNIPTHMKWILDTISY